MGQVLAFTVELTEINCGECSGTYAINDRYRRQREEKGGFWNCPYCKTSWGYSESQNARLKRELEAERKRKQDALERANIAEAAEQRLAKNVARLKNRVSSGVCPCCTRSFTNLQRHMASKHPDFAADPK